MSVTLVTYDDMTVTPLDDALVYETAIPRSGVIQGMAVSIKNQTMLHINGGHGIICGRKFTVNDEDIAVVLPASGTQHGRLYLRLDLLDTAEPIKLLTEVAATLTPPIQNENVNTEDGIYEFNLATFSATGTAIADLIDVAPRHPGIFKGATSAAAGEAGNVPAPGTANRDQFLKGNGEWSDLPKYDGATSTSAGTSGAVPAPQATSDWKFLSNFKGSVWRKIFTDYIGHSADAVNGAPHNAGTYNLRIFLQDLVNKIYGAFFGAKALPYADSFPYALSSGTLFGWRGDLYRLNANVASGAKISTANKTKESLIDNVGVSGVKGNAETQYRNGLVNITAANIGFKETSAGVPTRVWGSGSDLTQFFAFDPKKIVPDVATEALRAPTNAWTYDGVINTNVTSIPIMRGIREVVVIVMIGTGNNRMCFPMFIPSPNGWDNYRFTDGFYYSDKYYGSVAVMLTPNAQDSSINDIKIDTSWTRLCVNGTIVAGNTAVAYVYSR